jgi:signal transduction histidine kinase
MGNTTTRGTHHLFGAGVCSAVLAAHRTGLLEAVVKRPSTAEEHAVRLDLDPRATFFVLELLRSLGLIDCHEGIYRVGGDALSRFDPWLRMDQFLRHGVTESYIDNFEQRGEMYAKAAIGLAQRGEVHAGELADRLGRADRILDVGSGCAPWSLAMAERNDDATVVALDRPEVVEVLEKWADAKGMAARVQAVAGNYFESLPAGPFDRVVLAAVLHLETEEEAAELVARASGVLAEDGELVIIDMLGGDDLLSDIGRAGYQLHLGMRTKRGKPHALDLLVAWCRAAGLKDVRVVRPHRSLGSGALVARRGPERVVTDEGETVDALRIAHNHAEAELAALKRRHDNLFDGTTDALMVLAVGMDVVVDVNRVFADMFRVDWWPTTRPHPYEQLLSEHDRPAFRDLLQQVARGEVTSRRHRFSMKRADGEPFVAEVSCYDPGYRTSALFAIRDLTQEIEAQKRIERYARELEAANEELHRAQAELVKKEKMAALGALVAGMSHDINTPLGALKSNVALMEQIGDRLRTAERPRREQLLASLDDASRAAQSALTGLEETVRSLSDFATLEGAELHALRSEASIGLTRAIAEKIARD